MSQATVQAEKARLLQGMMQTPNVELPQLLLLSLVCIFISQRQLATILATERQPANSLSSRSPRYNTPRPESPPYSTDRNWRHHWNRPLCPNWPGSHQRWPSQSVHGIYNLVLLHPRSNDLYGRNGDVFANLITLHSLCWSIRRRGVRLRGWMELLRVRGNHGAIRNHSS